MKIANSVHSLPSAGALKKRLRALIATFARRRVLVVGDIIADEFIYGEVARVSREAPVLILKYDTTEMLAGGAGNAANNVAALGGCARLAGIVGDDAEGRRLTAALAPGVDYKHVSRVLGYRTPTKTRILAGGVHSAKQQVVRIDREIGWSRCASESSKLARRLSSAVAGCDAVVLSDYGSGLITPVIAETIRKALERRSRRAVAPMLVDSRYRLLEYRGMTICTPNESEVEQMLGVRIGDDARILEEAGRELLRRFEAPAVLITRG